VQTFPVSFIDNTYAVTFGGGQTDGDITYCQTLLFIYGTIVQKTASSCRFAGRRVNGLAGISTSSDFLYHAIGKWK
jgi:hypothetical protein